jgi:hypothetical protein
MFAFIPNCFAASMKTVKYFSVLLSLSSIVMENSFPPFSRIPLAFGYHPLAYYLKWTLDDAKRIYVCGELISIDLDDLRYNQPPSHQLRTFIWRVNASIPFGRPIFGGDAIGCL